MFNIHILECENDSYYYESKPYLIMRRYLLDVALVNLLAS
jgi:hypothetical protein